MKEEVASDLLIISLRRKQLGVPSIFENVQSSLSHQLLKPLKNLGGPGTFHEPSGLCNGAFGKSIEFYCDFFPHGLVLIFIKNELIFIEKFKFLERRILTIAVASIRKSRGVSIDFAWFVQKTPQSVDKNQGWNGNGHAPSFSCCRGNQKISWWLPSTINRNQLN